MFCALTDSVCPCCCHQSNTPAPTPPPPPSPPRAARREITDPAPPRSRLCHADQGMRTVLWEKGMNAPKSVWPEKLSPTAWRKPPGPAKGNLELPMGSAGKERRPAAAGPGASAPDHPQCSPPVFSPGPDVPRRLGPVLQKTQGRLEPPSLGLPTLSSSQNFKFTFFHFSPSVF